MSSVSILIIKSMVQYLSIKGYDIKKLFELAEEDISMLNDADYRVSGEQIDKIYEAAYQLTEDSSIGFQAGKIFKFNNLGLLGYFLENSSTGKDVYDKLIKYQAILGNGILTEIEFEADNFLLNLITYRDMSTIASRICLEKIITQNIQGMRMLTSEDIPVSSVHFKGPKPDNTEEFEEFVACPVYYNDSINGIRLPNRVLSNKIIQYNSLMEDQFSKLVQSELEKIFLNEDFASQVSQHIFKHYPSCKVDAEKVASDFNLGLRTFQRRLQLEETNFKNIIDEVKKHIAINYVKSNILALSEISYIMGFSEISSFYRSFKRWTGQTPKSFRRVAS